mmetsp:Transcript_4635/g.12341  ORF Transcript_4635/g.12341 Transcript_4635/m.12341 type:complete len:288 (+) Transcript_4635:360-1223(+)
MTFSSLSSLSVALIIPAEKSSTSRPITIDHFPPSHTHGREKHISGGTPYSPPLGNTAMDTRLPFVPCTQSRMWSAIALAADIADESPRAWMTAAPRLCTVLMNAPSSHARSSVSRTASPSTLAWRTSGYCVDEWLPQMKTSSTLLRGFFAASATIDVARLWSSRVRAVMFSSGMAPPMASFKIAAFVFAGLPTTRHLTVGFACSFTATPCCLKILTFIPITSLRSIPCLRGNAPRKMMASASLKATAGSVVHVTPANSGMARSSSSIWTPLSMVNDGSMSRRRRATG